MLTSSRMNISLRLYLLGTLLFSLYVNGEGQTDRPIVKTKQGKVQGIQDTNLNGQTYYAFRGIRYGKPPVGKRRFMRSEKVDSWKGVKDASVEGSTCRQFDLMVMKELGSEDCLFLNVFTPELNPVEKKAVMVWIHGGAFQYGSALPIYGPGKLMGCDVVLVTINYRLGVFGFLSTGDEVIPGNAGMWDQVLALKWVQENIEEFGGDPTKVTIFGESAGASSVSLLVMSPAAEGLFSRAITQSGTAFVPTANQKDPLTYAKQIASELNCPTDSSAAIREGLIGKSEDELFAAFQKVTASPGHPRLFFIPVVEGGSTTEPFLPDTPTNLVKSKRYNRVPVITGLVANEGGLFSGTDKVDKEFLDTLLAAVIENMTNLGEDQLDIEAVRQEYLTNLDFHNQHEMDTAMQQILSDVMFNAGNDAQMRKLVEDGATVYMYKLNYRGKNSFSRYQNNEHLGAVHGDDLQHLFDIVFLDGGKLTGDDQLISKRILSMWTNFAKTGNPTPSVTFEIPIKWKPVTNTDDINYLNIDKDLTIESNFRVDKARFWNKFVHH